MPKYLIESPHTSEECTRALEAIVEEDPGLLEKSWFGCSTGEHTEWATVEADSKEEARMRLPEFLREKARVVEVSQVTPEQISAMHQM